jgi:sirohydrochlorin ferrochelatase
MTAVLVAVSHGTSSPAGRTAVAGLVAAVRAELRDVEVVDAFVDVQEPELDSVVRSLPGPGVVVPLLLTPGFHVRVDVTRAIAGRSATAAPVLGPDAAITDVLLDRLDAVGLGEDDVVVLGVAGSRDLRAHHSVDRAAARLAMALGREVRVGHLGGTGRPIDEVVAEASASGRRVLVASYLLAPGYFAEVLRRCGAAVVTAPLLDGGPPDQRLVDLVVDRYRQATSAGPLRRDLLVTGLRAS